MSIRDMAVAAANAFGVPAGLFLGLVKQESGFNPYAVSPAGAYGPAQLMPGTAEALGVNIYDTQDNLNGGAKYLRQMYDKFGNWSDALAAYNAGPGRVAKVKAGTSTLPSETKSYVPSVINFAKSLFGWNGEDNAPAATSGFVPTNPDRTKDDDARDNSGPVPIASGTVNEGSSLLGSLFASHGSSIIDTILGGIKSSMTPKGFFADPNNTPYQEPATGEKFLFNGGTQDPTGGLGNLIAKVSDPQFWRDNAVIALGLVFAVVFVVYGAKQIIA